jgi:hypothetical protein
MYYTLFTTILALTVASFSSTSDRFYLVYKQDFESPQADRSIPGWSRLGGYSKTASLVDENNTTSSGDGALVLESHQWGAGENDGIDTVVTADLGLLYEPNNAYKIEVIFARINTVPGDKDTAPFYGELYLELWAGDPNKGGTLIGAHKERAVETLPTARELITFKTPRTASGSGNLFLRMGTVNALAGAQIPYAYQQAELDDIRIFAAALVQDKR